MDVKTQTPYKGDNKLIIGIVFGVISYWLFALSMSNYIPVIQNDLNVPFEVVNLAISLTSVFSGMFIIVIGGFADKYGHKKVTNIGFILYIIGSLFLVFANGAIMLFVGRIIQGFSAASIMPATLALMKTYFHGAERQRALSYWSIGSWGGTGLAPIITGAITTYLGWRAVFVVSIIIAIMGMFLIKDVPETEGSTQDNKKFDLLGICLLVVSVLSINIIITYGANFGWLSWKTISLLAVFITAGTVFYQVETNKDGFVDLSLFKNKAFTGATVSNFLLNATGGTILIATTYAQTSRNFTPFQSGMLTLGYMGSVLLTIRIGEKIGQKIGERKPMIWGCLATAIGIFMMSLTFIQGPLYAALVFVGFIFFGTGTGIYATPSTDTVMSSVPLEKAGVAGGIYKMASSIGWGIGSAISGAVYDLMPNTSLSAMFGMLTNVVFCIIAIVFIAMTVPKGIFDKLDA